MISRQLLQCLQHPQLLHSVGPAAAAAATASTPLWATAASQLLGSTAAAGSTFSASVPGIWRGFSADAPSSSLPADSVPWSSGLASSSQRQPGAPEPLVLRPEMYHGSFKAPAKSLQFNRGEVVYLPQLEGNRLGKGLLWLVGAYGKKQQLRNGASVLYQGITEAAENPELQQALGLEVGSFMAPFNLLSLHMWLIINRLHQEQDSKDNKFFLDSLYHDLFYKDIDRRVYAHGVQMRVSKWVDRLQKQFYGTSFAYDKAIRTEGGGQAQQAALVAALVKNVYNGDPANKPWAELMSRYLFRELHCLDATSAEAIYKGHIRFSTDIVKR